MADPVLTELRRLIHALREPIGALAIDVDLLEREDLTTATQALAKTMRTNMAHATAVFEEIDFVLENGHARPSSPRRPQ